MLSLLIKNSYSKVFSPTFNILNVSRNRSFTSISKNFLSKNNFKNDNIIFLKRKINTIETNRSSTKLRNTNWKDLKNIFALAAPYKLRLITGLSLLGVSSVIFLSAPRILGKLIDQHDDAKSKKQEEDDICVRLANFFKEKPYYLVGVFIIGALAIGARAYCMHTAGQLIINDLRTNVFKSVLKQDIKFFDNNKVGEIVSRLSSDALITGYSVSMNLSDGARALITMLGSGSLMIYTSQELCLLVSFVIPVILGTFFVFGRLQRRYTREMQEAVAGANMVATERLSNIRTVRMLAAEDKELAAYKQRINDIWNVAKKEGIAKGAMYGGFQFTGYMSLSLVVFYGCNLINQGLLTYGDLSSFLLYAILCASSLSNMSGFFVEIMKGLGASTRLFELQNSKPVIPLTGGLKVKDVHKKISFQNVSFCYPGRDPIFHDVSFSMDCGKVTALVGASGSGKSTVLSLLMRFYDPTSGNIYIDDHDLKDIDISYWRSHIGSVGQEPILFNTTIRNNITYGAKNDSEISDEQVFHAAEQSNALHFIERFPKKFDTMVGELSSSMLSGGEKQRISLSRALVLDPKVLILDEATSALDAHSEYMVRKALDKLIKERKQTILIIAHRLGTIKHADKIVVLDKGRIAEQGTFDELINIKDGVFKNLVDKQQIGWTNETF